MEARGLIDELSEILGSPFEDGLEPSERDRRRDLIDELVQLAFTSAELLKPDPDGTTTGESLSINANGPLRRELKSAEAAVDAAETALKGLGLGAKTLAHRQAVVDGLTPFPTGSRYAVARALLGERPLQRVRASDDNEMGNYALCEWLRAVSDNEIRRRKRGLPPIEFILAMERNLGCLRRLLKRAARTRRSARPVNLMRGRIAQWCVAILRKYGLEPTTDSVRGGGEILTRVLRVILLHSGDKDLGGGAGPEARLDLMSKEKSDLIN